MENSRVVWWSLELGEEEDLTQRTQRKSTEFTEMRNTREQPLRAAEGREGRELGKPRILKCKACG
jgi:hypothetical protein